MWFLGSPLLSKEGSRAAAGWSVQSPAQRLFIDARAKRSLLIGTFVFEQILMFRPIGLTLRAAPALATRRLPRLTKAGNTSPYSEHISWLLLRTLWHWAEARDY